eukprot:gb/GECG01006329.1/.p1 GENE.gb/GECG01006329.1/~~gb/GECG01006329.1/.p1  ORF type:complete len:459 (+),score=52.63 gb/GECG01006329.1/:1-1377(+)
MCKQERTSVGVRGIAGNTTRNEVFCRTHMMKGSTLSLCLALLGSALLQCHTVVAVQISSTPSPIPPVKKPNALLQLSARGTPFEVGYSIGVQTKHRIQSKVDSIQGLLDYVSSGDGKDKYESMLAGVQNAAKDHSGGNAFADALKELQGMAVGAGVSFKSLVVINMENELSLMKSAGKVLNDHCSDVLMRKAKCNDDPVDQKYCMMIGHNEDAGPNNLEWVYLLKGSIEGEGATLNIQAYNYPGQLSTGAFGFNYDSQIFFSTNAIFPKYVNSSGIPRHFLARYILASESIDQAITRATETSLACGFSLNIGSWGKNGDHLYNIELASTHQHSILTLGDDVDYTFHFNAYLRLDVPQHVGTSSVARMNAAKSLQAPTDMEGAFRILGDQSNSSYPIYRTGTPPDGAATLTTALFKVPLDSSSVNGLRSSTEDSFGPTMEVVMNNPRFNSALFVDSMKA